MRDIKTLLEILLDEYQNNPDDDIRSEGLWYALRYLYFEEGIIDRGERFILDYRIRCHHPQGSFLPDEDDYWWPDGETEPRIEFLKQLIKMPEQERIVCAAIHNPEDKDMAGEPLIYCGLRHADILWQSKKVSRNPYHQGFLTSTGRFVSREEALKIALYNNQVIGEIIGNSLYSENLY